ncbi:MAG TPA: hypothetical protein VFO58_13890 [Vicinamibacterales bacterium]|nr:hypothetical protein [Vicinamibacterales bacterium]
MQRYLTSFLLVLAFIAFAIASSTAQGPPAGGQGAAAGAPAQGQGRAGGGRGRGMNPSEVRSVPAESKAAKYAHPGWKAPRTAWGDPDIEGEYSSDDMRGVPMSRPAAQAARESLTPDEFLQRARGDEANKFSSVNTETFLRNEYGIRTFGYTSLIVDPPDGRQPAVTPAEQKRRAAQPERGTFSNVVLAGFDDFTLYDRCISRGVPGSVNAVLYGNGVRFVQSPTAIVMTYEMIHESRVIHLGSAPPRAPAHGSWTGYSVGRWEGDTLVVETKGFNSRTATSENLKLTEWFTRVDPDMVEYRYRIDDPGVYTAPYTVRMMLTTQPNYFVMEYSCHEGNSAVEMGLKGERAYERSVEEARAKGLPIPERMPRNMDVYSGRAAGPVREIGFETKK